MTYLVLDAFHKVHLTQPSVDMVSGLSKSIGMYLPNLRLVLVGFTQDLPVGLRQARLLDETSELTDRDLMEFFAKAYKESRVSIEPSEIALKTRTVLGGRTGGSSGFPGRPGGQGRPRASGDMTMDESDLSIDELVAQAMALRDAEDLEVHTAPVVRGLGGAGPQPATRPARVSGYEEAAAVLGWFDPDRLRSTIPEATESDLDALCTTAIDVVDERGDDVLSISSNRRVEVLGHLRETGNVERALQANKASEQDQLHSLITTLVTGGSVDIEEQTLGELHSLAMVCDWLHRAGFEHLPDPTRLQDRIDLLTLLEPLELLAGTNVRRQEGGAHAAP